VRVVIAPSRVTKILRIISARAVAHGASRGRDDVGIAARQHRDPSLIPRINFPRPRPRARRHRARRIARTHLYARSRTDARCSSHRGSSSSSSRPTCCAVEV
jgi:hypothetical protein